MKSLIIALSLMTCSTGYNTDNIVLAYRVYTYGVRLKTRNDRWLTDTVTAASENDAKYIIYQRYPGCTIYSIWKIGADNVSTTSNK